MTQGNISEKQEEILQYIRDTILKKGYPPSVREICEAVRLKSTSSVHSHLATLEERGYIRRDPTKPRTIEILDDSFSPNLNREMANLPVVGTVEDFTALYPADFVRRYDTATFQLLPDTAPQVAVLTYGK